MKALLITIILILANPNVSICQSDSVIIDKIIHAISGPDTIGFNYKVNLIEIKGIDTIFDNYTIQYYKTPNSFYYQEKNNTLKNEDGISILIDAIGNTVYFQKATSQINKNSQTFFELELLKHSSVSKEIFNNREFLTLTFQNSEYKNLKIYFDTTTYLPVFMLINFNPKYEYNGQAILLSNISMSITIETFVEYDDISGSQIKISDVLIFSENEIQLTQQFSDYELFKLSE